MRTLSFFRTVVLAITTSLCAQAQVTPVAPFVGERFEGFETQHTSVGGGHPASHASFVVGGIFGGQAGLFSLEAPFLISVGGSSHATCTLLHRTGNFQCGSLFRDFQIVFLNDQQMFGGYFATDNPMGPGFGLVEIEFQDRFGVVIGVQQEVLFSACGEYTWHGWKVPGLAIVKMRASQPGLSIYMDDLVVSSVNTIGEVACQPNETSLEERSTCGAVGSAVAAVNNFTLQAAQLPQQTFGIFLCSPAGGHIPMPGNSQGILCLGGPLGRFNRTGEIQFSGLSGTFSLAVDLQSLPQPLGTVAVSAGDTWHFQAWFRDVDSTPQMNSTSNFTGSLRVAFQ